MPIWFRPWMAWLAAVAALSALLAIQTVRLSEAEKATADEVAAHAETQRDYAEKLAEAISTARQTETDLRASLDKLQDQAAKEKADAKAREDDLVERVRTGERRLSIAAVCRPGASGTGLRAPAASGGRAEVPRADIDPAAGVALIGIARDGDEAIRERNACISAYESVRSKLNAMSQVSAGGSGASSYP